MPPGANKARHTRRLLALAWQHRGRSLAVLLLQLVLLLLGLAGLTLTGFGIDVLRAAVADGPRPRAPLGLLPPASSPLGLLVWVGGAVFVLALLRAALTYLYTVSVGQLVQVQIVPQLREAVYGKLQQLSFRFFDATNTGSIMNRVTSDVQNVRAFVDQVLIQGLVMVLALSVSLAYMLSRHVTLTLVCLVSTPVLFILTRTFSRRVRADYEESRNRADALLSGLAETIQGMHVIKGFGREQDRLAELARRNQSLRAQQRDIFARVSRFTPAIDAAGHVNLAVLLGAGGLLVARKQLSLGDLVVFAGLLQQFGNHINTLGNVVNTLQQSLISASRVFEVLDRPLDVASPAAPCTPSPFVGTLTFENVDFSYQDGSRALVDACFTVRAGQRVVLFGETGSGKTTLLSLVPRFYDPDRGRVLISGQDTRTLALDQLRAHIAVLFQESFLFSTTVADNIAFGKPDARFDELERAARRASAHDFITALPHGYDTVLEEGGSNLSGGQRQRLALARALVREPTILLLDDPTAAVDAETEQDILAALAGLPRPTTVLLATNRVAACRDADTILVMEQGRIIDRGTHDELVQRQGPFAAAARLQAHSTAQPAVRRAADEGMAP